MEICSEPPSKLEGAPLRPEPGLESEGRPPVSSLTESSALRLTRLISTSGEVGVSEETASTASLREKRMGKPTAGVPETGGYIGDAPGAQVRCGPSSG